MRIEVKTKVAGKRRIQVMRNGECRFDSKTQPNFLVDNFFNRLTKLSWAQTRNSYELCHAGSGTSAPVPEDTHLVSRIGSQSWEEHLCNTRSYDGESTDGTYIQWSETRYFPFNEGSIIGNVSEIGVTFGVNSTSGSQPIHSRFLVTDDQGNPTTLVLTAEDQLVVTHELQWRYPVTPLEKQITVLGQPYTMKWAITNPTGYGAMRRFGTFYYMCISEMKADSSGHAGTSVNATFPTVMGGNTNNGFYGQAFVANPTTFDTFTAIESADNKSFSAEFSYSASSANPTDPAGGLAGFEFGYDSTQQQDMASVFQFIPPLPKNDRHKLTLTLHFTVDRA